MTKHSAPASDLSPQVAESLAKLKRVIDLGTAAAKRDLAQWLDGRAKTNPARRRAKSSKQEETV